ncbi:MAG: alpha-galactosidase [Lachnospiraceae bacterium]|nr:alpha-galactosidase [Lachnospiraceae bacterium]
MIRRIGNDAWILDTKDTTYAFKLLPTGQPEHLYYGKKADLAAGDGLVAVTGKYGCAPGVTCIYDKDHPEYSLDDVKLEMSSYGKGDLREPFIELSHFDGNVTCDFVYEKDVIDENKSLIDLPASYSDDDKYEHLVITLVEKDYDLKLELHYYVYPECNIICRQSRLINESSECVTVKRLMSTQLDFDETGFVFTSFHGAWGREMQRNDVSVTCGKFVNSARSGASSNRANPFVMLHPAYTSENRGEVFGLNLIYSGNHYEAAEVSPSGKLRFVSGINPAGFEWKLLAGESFDAPEAVMTYSECGFNGMSRNMHSFVRDHIIRREWKRRERPVLLNSWEAAYFDINEEKLLKLASAAKNVGIELFVVDDGWFGRRNDDTTSLGDWDANKEKLPGGLKGLADKVRALGLQFGIWVEPEMISVRSDLYTRHPDWVIDVPGKAHSEGRNQRILDLADSDVCDHLVEKLSEVFASADISYVKWDMNRTFSDVFSRTLSADRQGEVFHRYIRGFYSCLKRLMDRFPDILFEGCSSGGNRFDLGALSYFPQIWASDNTDALCRIAIQTGYSYGYPPECATSHVSASPNHQTHRETPLSTRFNVAAFGNLGYEFNLCELSEDELAEIRAQIGLYKQWRSVFMTGSFYRGRNGGSANDGGALGFTQTAGGGMAGSSMGNITEWTVVSADRKKAVGLFFQNYNVPNIPFHTFHARGLEEKALYRFYNMALTKDGADTRYEESVGRTENVTASGDVLMSAGVHLTLPFGGAENEGAINLFEDFGSGMYFMEA